METLPPRCAGIDVHKKTAAACVRCAGAPPKDRQEVRTFSTLTADLLTLADWLAERGATHVAMEPTGVYWVPVYHLPEGRFTLLLVNAQHVKQVPGRKAAVKDCQWLAELLQCGLLKASFVPPAPIRRLRDLTRQRAQLVGEKTAVANRTQKVPGSANVKLASVASAVPGASGRGVLEALWGGTTGAAQLADLARGRLRDKPPALRQALAGRMTEHHRFLLRTHLGHLGHPEEPIGRLGARGEEVTAPFAQAAQGLTAIPGVSQRVAETVAAEIGTDVNQFATAGHLASRTGAWPGNNESAGKRQSGKATKGDRWPRTALAQAAWAASHTKETYLAARYRSLARRRGRKRALMAVGHTLLVIVYHLLKDGTEYRGLGPDYLDRLQSERLPRQLVKRLEGLGHKVTLSPRPAA